RLGRHRLIVFRCLLRGQLTFFRVCILLFFFSSRRRHTRSKRDWSSDVCSSDLGFLRLWPTGLAQPFVSTLNSFDGTVVSNAAIEIGRASCRERVEISVVVGSVKRKKERSDGLDAVHGQQRLKSAD